MLSTLLWIYAFIWSTHCLGLEKYDGFQILRAYPHHNEHVTIMKRAAETSKGQAEVLNENEGILDMMISPAMLQEITQLCKELDIPLDVVVPNLPDAIKQQVIPGTHTQDANHFDIAKYNTLSQINTWLMRMQENYFPMMKVLTIGQSFEGRPLQVAQLAIGDTHGKPAIWLDAGIHSNEWLGPSTMLYFIHQFLESMDTELHRILEDFVVFIMPVMNVDGYEYTWQEDRFWRKSRSTQPISTCVGVDLNRNWDFAWRGSNRHSQGSCDRNYGGRYAFSEPETIAVSSFLRHNHSVSAYIAYHSYSQYWMTPYGFTAKNKPPNQIELAEMAGAAARATEAVHGTKYTVGSVAQLIGETFGSSIDYTYKRLGIKYSFGVELRDRGLYGTLVPPDQIIPNGEESLAGLKALCQELRTKLGHDNLNGI